MIERSAPTSTSGHDVGQAAFAWSDFEGVLFDLDGVITPTAEIHERAWAELFAAYDYTPEDYLAHIDGKPRYDGVRHFLASRGVELPEGDPSDAPGTDSVCAMGNAKNAVFNEILATDGIAPYPGSLALLNQLDAQGVPSAIVSSSRNAVMVLAAAGLADRFDVVVDGLVAAEMGVAGKPAPGTYLLGAERLGVDPARTIVVEDAISGVAAGAAGGFAEVIGVDRGAGADALAANGATIVVDDLDRLLDSSVRRRSGMHRKPVPTGLPEHRFPVDPWRLVETEYNADDLGTTETLFGIGNGYLGMRANPEEGRDAHTHGTYLNGFHETWEIEHAENAVAFAKTGQTIVNVPDAKLIKLYVDDEPLLLSGADLESYERAIDFRTGILSRDLVWRTPAGKRVRVRSERMVSLTHRHLAVFTFEVTLLDSASPLGPGSPIVISSQLLNRQDGEDEYHVAKAALGEGKDPRQARKFARRVLEPRLQQQVDHDAVLGYRAVSSRMTMACATRHVLETGCETSVSTELGEDLAKTVFSLRGMPGETIRLTKYVAYHSSTGVPAQELADRCRRTLDRAEDDGLVKLRAEQTEFLNQWWATSDVEVRGDDKAQQAMRWNLFQLAQASVRTQDQGIAAKGVTAGGYDGHYFWDTEVYVVPFLVYTNPEAARSLLRFRWKMLDAARQRAEELSQVGALYPWRTINGAEASAYYAAGTAQYHINAAVAFAIRRYLDATNDLTFLAEEAAEILIETARLWADLGFYATNGGKTFHIHRVTGPDEYTTVVNDNTYTNLMAQFNLRYAARTVRMLAHEDPPSFAALCRRTSLDLGELDDWDAAADAMHIPYDDELEIHPQDSSFLELEPWIWDETTEADYPLLMNYHPLVIYRHQVLKQADVVLAMFIRTGDFSVEQKRRNFDYYDPITTGDSALSACVQSIVAAEVGRDRLAEDYFHRALYLDLSNTQGNTADGVHIASTGGTWAAVVHGFAGMSERGNYLEFSPSLPPSIEGLTFRLLRQGARLRVDLDHEGCTVTVEDGGPDGNAGVVVNDGEERIALGAGESYTVAPDPDRCAD